MLRTGCATIGLLVAGLALPASAVGDSSDPDAVQVHAFISQGALLSIDNNYLAHDTAGTLEFDEAGINFTKRLDDRLSAGVQLFARDLGGSDYNAAFDWFDLDYHWQDWLGVRAGRVKLPFGLYNDTSDIDAAQPVVLLPQSIYAIQDRTFTLAQTGLEVYGFKPIGHDNGALQYELYGGALTIPLASSAVERIDDDRVPYLVGGRVMYETPVDGLRVGVSGLTGHIDGHVTVLEPVQLPSFPFTIKTSEAVGSIEYLGNGILLAAEYLRQHTYLDEDPLPDQVETSEAMYALAGYRWRPWLTTTAYYSLLYPNAAAKSGIANHQHDAALCLRFDINPHWLVKLEGHFMRGTAGLSGSPNGDVPLDMLADQWGLFAAKTTVYF
nr:hypothetical protein [Kofleriaceae bacterium]